MEVNTRSVDFHDLLKARVLDIAPPLQLIRLTGSVTPPIRVEDGLEVRAALKDSEASVSFKADTG